MFGSAGAGFHKTGLRAFLHSVARSGTVVSIGIVVTIKHSWCLRLHLHLTGIPLRQNNLWRFNGNVAPILANNFIRLRFQMCQCPSCFKRTWKLKIKSSHSSCRFIVLIAWLSLSISVTASLFQCCPFSVRFVRILLLNRRSSGLNHCKWWSLSLCHQILASFGLVLFSLCLSYSDSL